MTTRIILFCHVDIFEPTNQRKSLEGVRNVFILMGDQKITDYDWSQGVLLAMKITMAMGEATSDYLVYHINPYLAI